MSEETISYTIEDWLGSLAQASQMLEDGTTVVPVALGEAIAGFVLSRLGTVSEDADQNQIVAVVNDIALACLLTGSINEQSAAEPVEMLTAQVSPEGLAALMTQSIRYGAIQIRLETE